MIIIDMAEHSMKLLTVCVLHFMLYTGCRHVCEHVFIIAVLVVAFCVAQ